MNVLNICCCPKQGPEELTMSLNVIFGVPDVHPDPADALAIPAIEVEGIVEEGQAVYVPGQVIVGLEQGELQLTVTVNDAVFVFPQLSIDVYITVVLPEVNKVPGCIFDVNEATPQLSVD